MDESISSISNKTFQYRRNSILIILVGFMFHDAHRQQEKDNLSEETVDKRTTIDDRRADKNAETSECRRK